MEIIDGYDLDLSTTDSDSSESGSLGSESDSDVIPHIGYTTGSAAKGMGNLILKGVNFAQTLKQRRNHSHTSGKIETYFTSLSYLD